MFKITVATPDKRIVYDQEIEEITLPANKGELNILPGHAPLLTTLESGIMRWKFSHSGHISTAVISWGFCQVSPTGVNILAEIVDLPEEIEIKEVEEQIKVLEHRIATQVLDDSQYSEVTRELQRNRSKQAVLFAKTHS